MLCPSCCRNINKIKLAQTSGEVLHDTVYTPVQKGKCQPQNMLTDERNLEPLLKKKNHNFWYVPQLLTSYRLHSASSVSLVFIWGGKCGQRKSYMLPWPVQQPRVDCTLLGLSTTIALDREDSIRKNQEANLCPLPLRFLLPIIFSPTLSLPHLLSEKASLCSPGYPHI